MTDIGIIGELIAAAAEARKATVKVGVISRDVEIVLTEQGLIVRGTTQIGDLRAWAAQEIDWPEFHMGPSLLANSVRLVVAALSAREEQERK